MTNSWSWEMRGFKVTKSPARPESWSSYSPARQATLMSAHSCQAAGCANAGVGRRHRSRRCRRIEFCTATTTKIVGDPLKIEPRSLLSALEGHYVTLIVDALHRDGILDSMKRPVSVSNLAKRFDIDESVLAAVSGVCRSPL